MSKATITYLWVAVTTALVLWAVLLFRLSDKFSYAFDVPDMPIKVFVGLLVAGGAVFCILPVLVRLTLARELGPGRVRYLVGLIFIAGLGMRMLLMFSEPMLEDDYQRYMWDGAQMAHGINPYLHSPEAAQKMPGDTEIGQLATASGAVLSRVNHPELKTVYPLVTQLFFAAAHYIAPFKIVGWRVVILTVDFCVLGLLILLLREVGRSPVWLALYWLNPVVAKEFYNSAHMDILIAPFVLGAIYLTLKGRIIPTLVALAFGVGVKIWPVFLLPVLLRHNWKDRGQLRSIGIGLGLFVVLCGLWVWPVFIAGFDQGSGFVAYVEKWQTNSALFPAIKSAFAWGLSLFAAPADWAGRGARVLVIGVLGLVSIYTARLPVVDGSHLITRAGVMVLAVVLLSPAQFPWYLTWFAPFLVFLPLWGAMVLHIFIVLYYLGFHYIVIDDYSFYTNVVVWLIWVPVWTLLIFETVLKTNFIGRLWAK